MTKQVPDFLLENVEVCSDDQKKLLLDLQSLALWREIQGNKPYDREKALKLRTKLALQRDIQLRNFAEEKIRIQNNAEKALQISCSSVAEVSLGVEIYSENPEDISTPSGEICFNDKITDKRSGITYGTARELLLEDGINWTDCGNPSEDLVGFVANLKKRYGEFSRTYSFRRPNEPKNTRFCRFTLKLKCRSFSDAELSKKFPQFAKRR
ncbi:hypothetical protein D4R42_05485 [bacterium]|nr:MAG: hypothetical protein D4R42_05485 [bacterium]